MKAITKTLKNKPFDEKIFMMYFKDKTYAVFDIETTGLSASSNYLILSGIIVCSITSDESTLFQFFAENENDEKEIINNTLNILKSVDYIITYNGRHFDIPFITKRGNIHNIDFKLNCYNLDLYLILNGHSDLKSFLPNLKQKTVESFMGLSNKRQDEISGADSVKLYSEYIRTKSVNLENKILLHNHDDIIQLLKLLPIIRMVDFHKAMFKLGFVANNYKIDKIIISGKDLTINGIQLSNGKDYISFPTDENPYHMVANKSDSTFQLTIPGQSAYGAIYIDVLSLLDNVDELKRYPSYENGYLIIKNHNTINYMEINSFIITFLSNFTL